jgi:hypothetical protein
MLSLKEKTFFFFHQIKTMQTMRVHNLFRSSHSVYLVCEGQDIWHFCFLNSLNFFSVRLQKVMYFTCKLLSYQVHVWILNDSIQGWCACMCVPARLDAASEQATHPFRVNFRRQGAEIVRSWLEPEVPKLKTMPWYFQKTKAASGARRMWPSRFRSAAAAGSWSQIAALASPIIKWI